MKIVNNTPNKPTVLVGQLRAGSVYKMLNSPEVFMVIQTNEPLSRPVSKCSVSLNTGRIIPWDGHERSECVILNATLEVSE